MAWTVLYGAALALALLAVWHWGGYRIKGAAQIVAAVWVINLGYALGTGDYANWRFLFAVDMVAAAMTLTPPCNPSRLVIGVLYIAQLCFHGVYGWYVLQGLEGPRDAYLSGLYVLGGAQIASLMIGAFDDWSRKRSYRRSLGGVGAVAVAPVAPCDGNPA